ncbi:hypothetical protein [Marinobacter metalliresistant]|uniref:Beta-3-deoxy-D-manno-oct-2-ulosonic acid transferase n=1 Tax=Marinobacter metalliresistant TaxID=2961995 RepID=A0ABZ2W4T9_9GAMM
MAQNRPDTPNNWQQFAHEHGIEGRPVVAFGFNPHWRPALASFVQGVKIRHVRHPGRIPGGAVVLVWGSRKIAGLPDGSITIRLEDGFLRSVGLGAEFARPLSWVADFDHLYFDAEGPSRLENLLNTHVFNEQEQERAQNLLDKIQEAGITKYNTGYSGWQRPEGKVRVILVPGQVESDASIRFGSPEIRTNMALLSQVREANPDAWIIYKPHPDVVAGARKAGEKEASAPAWCDEVVTEAAMDALLAQVDEVHTMTSLTGFEALIRNKRVICYGLPFYAGWGLTTDKLACERRQRVLSLTELAHATLIQYPFYVSRQTGNYVSPEQILDVLQQWRGSPSSWRAVIKKQTRKAINVVWGKT